MFKYSILALIGAASYSEAVILSYSESDGGRILVETAGGDPLSGGSLFIGSYNGPVGAEDPPEETTFLDIGLNFSAFAQLTPEGSDTPTQSDQNGIFSTGEFDGELSGFEGDVVYMLIIDTLSIDSATEFAFLGSSTDPAAWTFPADDFAFPSGTLSFPDVDNFFAGDPSDLLIPGAGTFPSIQLQAVPEPSSLFLVGIASLGLLRRRR